MTTATSGVLARFPLLLPVRNSFARYGASAVTRTSDRGHVAEARNQGHRSGGVSIRVSKETFLPLNVHRCSVSSIKMLKTVHQRCVMRMRMNTMDVRMRLGDAIDPFHLANGFEAVIGYECQERSNPLSLTRTIHTSHARCDKAGEWVGGSLQCSRGILLILWMSLRVGIVPCVSKIDTLGLFLSLLKQKLCCW